jgi:branched-chain amino acid aminotransferase
MVEKAEKIWFDGEFVPWDDARVHVLAQTLHYGLGAFEGIRAYQTEDGRTHVFRLREHIQRLIDSARLLHLEVPFSVEELCEACKETLRVNNQQHAYLRPLVYVDAGQMGLGARDNAVRVAIATWKWGAYLGDEGIEKGIRAKVSSFSRNHPRSLFPKAKAVGHYVNSILAKHEALRAGYDEAIMLDHEGFVSEASGANLFIVRDGKVKTPPYSSAILGGITWDCVCQIFERDGYEISYERFYRDELYLSDEVFFCGTAAEVTPVREIDDLTIGEGTKGPICTEIQQSFFNIVEGKSDDFPEWRDWLD